MQEIMGIYLNTLPYRVSVLYCEKNTGYSDAAMAGVAGHMETACGPA